MIFKMKKALFYFSVFVGIILFSCAKSTDLPKVFSASAIKTKIASEYAHNLDKFKKDFICEFLDWEVTTQEALERAREIITLLLETQSISQEDFAWFSKILQKRALL
jgi:hypothetical protein